MKQLCLALAMGLAAGAAPAQDAEIGGRLFFTYCGSCHGDDARGGGVMTAIMNVAAPDLTQLADGNGGVFPRTRVVYRIDGRDPLAAHGGDMPVFGDIFEGTMMPMKAETGQPILTGQGIVDIIAWLESVQR
jgi:mono/diheme cytochrome c family protein